MTGTSSSTSGTINWETISSSGILFSISTVRIAFFIVLTHLRAKFTSDTNRLIIAAGFSSRCLHQTEREVAAALAFSREWGMEIMNGVRRESFTRCRGER